MAIERVKGKQRDRVKMTEAGVEQFLHEARTMTMSMLQAGGTIHSVAVWYGFLHERVGPRRGELQVGADGVHERDPPVGSAMSSSSATALRW
jgi:hypothetical protein